MTLNRIKQEINNLDHDARGARIFTDKLKQKIVDYHYENNISISKLAKELSISSSVAIGWKKKLGKDATAFYYGQSIRHDARTKAIAVKKYKDGETIQEIAEEYHVSENTVYNWIKRYTNNYDELINLPDGVPYIIPEENHIYGIKNIKEVIESLDQSINKLETMLSMAEEENISLGKTTKKNIENKISKNQERKETLIEAEKIIKSTKSD